MKRKRLVALGVGALALVAAAAAGGGWAWRTIHRPYLGWEGPERVVEIPRGSDARSILEQLERQGVVASAPLARAYFVWALGRPVLKAGDYAFSRPATIPEVLERLVRGEVVSHPVTLPEGLTLEETAARLAEEGFGDYDALVAEMSSPERISDLDPEAEDLEGYLFPDTYAFARGTGEAAIVSALVAEFRRRWEREVVPLLASLESPDPGSRPSAREIVTLASIVEKEAGLDEERPTIAGVYANRLARGIALYADPTVIFALKKLGRWDGNLRRVDLQMDSGYNTYKYPGLPPGPICSPGSASLLAAAAPPEVPYLYFVSRNDGSHVFASTLAEHNRNVARWQKQYWRERWARERKAAADAN